MDKKPNGYWSDFQVLKDFLMPLCNNVGRMLQTNEIKEYKGLQDAIVKHGGIKKVAQKLGLNIISQYKTLSGNIVRSTYEVIVDNFLFLNDIDFIYEGKIIYNKNYLYDFKVKDCFIEIWGFIGKNYNINRINKENVYLINNLKLISLNASDFCNKSLFEINDNLVLIMKNNKIKQSNFNENLSKLNYFESYTKDKIIEELKNEFKNNSFTHIPNREWWRKSKFRKKIKFLEGKMTMYELSEILRLQPNEKPKKYWKNFENFKFEILQVYKELKTFPTQKMLTNLNRTDITNAASRYHGGLLKVKIQLNL